MGGLSIWHWIVVIAVLLLLFGRGKISELMGDVAQGIKEEMAKRAAEPKPAPPQAEDRFVELMLVAADFVKNCRGLVEAKKALADAGQFIRQAGGVSNARIAEVEAVYSCRYSKASFTTSA